MLKTSGEDKTYASILSDGRIHITVPEGTEGAVIRKYKTSDGLEGQKTEKVYTEVIGKITGIAFRDGEYGTQLQVDVDDGTNEPVCLSLATSSNYGEDMMKKLMNVDMERTVKIVPFSFKDDKGKQKRGVTIWQHNPKTKKNEKIQNYFYDAEAKKNINGYPEPKPKKGKTTKDFTKENWKLYFGECREFLIDIITEHFKIEKTATTSSADEDFDAMVEEASKAIDS
jgi:hypothetical protein